MNYEIITIQDIDSEVQHVVITNDDGSIRTFPADESNPHYQQFLTELDAEPKV